MLYLKSPRAKHSLLAATASVVTGLAVVVGIVLTPPSAVEAVPKREGEASTASSPAPLPQVVPQVVPPVEEFTSAAPETKPSKPAKPEKVKKAKKSKPKPKKEKRKKKKPEPPPPPTAFRVGSFNVLGCNHTVGKHGRKGYRTCGERSPGQVQMVREANLSVVGLQEFQYPQRQQWQRLMPNWSFAWGRPDASAVAWDKRVWTFVESATVGGKYFGGSPVAYPQIKLKHKITGQEVWFLSVHNPADVRGPAAHLRQHSTALQGAHARTLAQAGTPVIFTGDVNDRERFACPYARLSASVGADGTHWDEGSCQVGKVWIDQILGTTPITWSEFLNDWRAKDRRLSDHPLVVATAEIPTVLP